jgi:HAD superfamily hydrolase (TIGR01509 family)
LTVLLAFDLMDTLVTDPFRQAHEAATGRPMTELAELGLTEIYHHLECGRLTEGEYWQRLRALGIRADVGTFHRVRRAGYRWLPGMRDLLADCAVRHPTVVASNYPPWIDWIGAEMFDGLPVDWYPSYRCGARKPSARYFTGLCATFGTRMERLVLIDDKPGNTDAVRALRGQAITFVSAAETRLALAALVTSLGG